MNPSTHIKRLEDVAYLAGRIGWKGLTAKEYTQEGPYFLSVHGLNYGSEVDFRHANHISQARYDESPEIMLREGDVLICKDGAGIGKTGIVGNLPGPATINSSLLLIRAGETLLPKFLYYYLSSPAFQALVQEKIDGATTPHLYQREIRHFPIPILSLIEQRRLVTILDEAFEGIAKARANAERNLANARELPDALLEKALEPQDGWQETILAEIAEFKNGLNFTRTSKGETIRIVGVKDFQNEYWVPSDDLEYVTIDGKLAPSYELHQNDILTVRSNGNKQLIGRCIIAGNLPEKTSHSGFTIRIRVTSPKVNPEFLAYALKGRSRRASLVASGGGANISSLNQGALSCLPIAFPDMNIQAQIVDKIHSMMDTCKQLHGSRTHRLSQIDGLKRSLLQKAFSGDLTGKKIIATTAQFSSSVDTATPAFTADILAFAYSKHQTANRNRTFGRVKGQKVLHLVESIGGVELGRMPIKDAAGPNDSMQMRKAEAWAAENDYFTFVQRSGGGYDFVKGRSFDRLYAGALARLGTHRSEIGLVVDLLVPMDSEEAEVFATVHAAWNNLLLDGKQPTDPEILYEARENWHASKLKIPQSKFLNALRRIKAGQLVPTGSGKRVGGQEALL